MLVCWPVLCLLDWQTEVAAALREELPLLHGRTSEQVESSTSHRVPCISPFPLVLSAPPSAYPKVFGSYLAVADSTPCFLCVHYPQILRSPCYPRMKPSNVRYLDDPGRVGCSRC